MPNVMSSPSTDHHYLNKIPLSEGESLRVESSAMLACKNVTLVTEIGKSVFKRYFFGGEGFFQNLFTAQQGGGWIAFEEAIPGQIASYTLQPGDELTIGRSAFVASDKNIAISNVYAGVKGWWKGVGVTKMVAKSTDENPGRIFFNSAAGIVKAIKITPEDGSIIVDNDNIVAYCGVEAKIKKIGGFKSFLFSGEGTVNEFTGNGLVFVGSGESAARANMAEKIVKIVTEALLPDPVTFINRVTIVAALYFIANSSYLSLLAKSIESLGQSLQVSSNQIVLALNNASARGVPVQIKFFS